MLAWIAGLAAAVLLAGNAWALTKLTPKEIQDTFFTGEGFVSSTPSNIKFKMVFTTDGKMTREPVSRAARLAYPIRRVIPIILPDEAGPFLHLPRFLHRLRRHPRRNAGESVGNPLRWPRASFTTPRWRGRGPKAGG